MKLVRRTNNHKVAVFFPDPARDNDKEYHKEVQLALFELEPKGWWSSGRRVNPTMAGSGRQYNLGTRTTGGITHSELGYTHSDWGDGVDMIEELRTPTRVVDFNQIG